MILQKIHRKSKFSKLTNTNYRNDNRCSLYCVLLCWCKPQNNGKLIKISLLHHFSMVAAHYQFEASRFETFFVKTRTLPKFFLLFDRSLHNCCFSEPTTQFVYDSSETGKNQWIKIWSKSYLIARNVQAGFRIAEITDRWHFLDAIGVMILTHFLAHGMRVLRLGFDI